MSDISLQLAPFAEIAERFRTERSQRLGRTTLEPNDFEDLASAGYLSLSVPQSEGGNWAGLKQTGPQFAEITRTLARGDASVALVAAMHPAVVAYWHASPTDQAHRIFESVSAGHWWGTMMSEPGSGGDIGKTKTTAQPGSTADHFLLSGEKHFGSGSGQTSYMVTTARHDDRVNLFVIDMRDKDWNGDQGLTLLREWDGHGMTATQSHAFTLDNCDAELADSGRDFAHAISQTSSISGVLFSAVIIGILDEAFDAVGQRLRVKRDSMRALERVELVRAHNEHWQATTLYEAVRDAMGTEHGLDHARQAKYAIARHAENALNRLSKVVGGSSFGRTSSLGQFAQDVKALGFLRPPWALQNDQLFDAIWNQED